MPASLISDWLDQPLSATEDQGAITDVTRTFLVQGLTAGTGALAEALSVPGIPEYGDAYPGNANIICKTRSVEILESAPTKARVTCNYVTRGQEDGQFTFSCTTSVQQESTATDAGGNQITVSYGDDDQIVEADVYRPQITLSATGFIATSQPVVISSQWAGYLNSETWQGFAPGCWMCTRADWVAHDLQDSPPRYKFTFEFQLNTKGWTPTVYYRDASGNVPPDVVFGVGYKRVVMQGYRDFSERFPG